MQKIVLLIFVLCISLFTFSQNQKGSVTLSIINDQKAPLENVTVELLRSKDSALVKAALSDKSGTASFENIALGTYLAKATMVGYLPRHTTSFSLSEEQATIQLPTLIMTAAADNHMQGVTVATKKPFIQKLSDRIVVNVENSIIGAGSSALDVLERSPGVTVDQNDAISLRGRSGVIIMIDGKPTPMSGNDLANYLRGLPSNAIERIDIITNP
ncbi:MAG: carboxypeptidase regulatory-like domain-containing protein, partial [Flavisolibacter sp.]|nr:carboxypeptidase regulatory-like domain-containing protein [Flavisolibacter sp.]